MIAIDRGRLAAVASFSAIALCAAAPASAETLDEIYAKAKTEGAFVLYAGGPTAPWEARAKIFQQRYPGIKMSITGGFSNVLNARINKQIAAGKLEVDAGVFQTLQDFVRWKAQGHLLHYKPVGFDAVDPSFKDGDGAYYGVYVNAMPYMVNTQLVKESDVPNSALDFLKPQFHGKAVAAYPADDDATLYVFHTIVQKYGWSFMEKYKATKPNYIQGHLPEQRSIAAGKNLVSFDSIFSITGRIKATGAPVAAHFSTVDPLPIWPLAGAIFKKAPHPNAAKLFMSWFLEPAQQSKTGTWSPRRDVPPPAGTKPIFSYNVANGYLAFLTNATQLAELRKRYEHYTGPVVNVGGVR